MSEYYKRFIKENFLEILISIPKTIYFNLKVLPLKYAVKIPFAVSIHVKLKGVNRKSFICNSDGLSTLSCRIGFGSSYGAWRENKKGLICITKGGKIILEGKIGLSQGCILIANNGIIRFGDNFRCNYSTTIECVNNNITFGKEVVCGWHVTVKNYDGHALIDHNQTLQTSEEIVVGNHVWLCAYSTLLKGIHLGDDSVVSYGSIVTNSVIGDGMLYAAVPAKIINSGINWKE